MKTSLIIYRPLPVVWEYFTEAENWQGWWGGALESVVPAWEEGAILRWSQGEPTSLTHFLTQQQIALQGKWMETFFRFAGAPGGGTRLEVEILPRGGASFPDGGKAHIEDISAAIDRLKRLLEGTPLPAPQPVIQMEPAPVIQAGEAPSLRGRSYLALIAAMIGVGFVLSLIPCLVINLLFAGALAAWLWVRREVTPPRLCLRRGLLAGMLAGLGGTLVGSLFFLWDIPKGDFTAILMAVTAALALFMLPAALAGLLTGFVLRRRGARQAAISEVPLPPPETALQSPGTALPPMLSRESIESRMQTSVSQGLAQLTAAAQADTTRQLIAQIMSGAEFAFAVDSMLENLPACLAEQSPRSAVRQFSGTLVAVTVFPVWMPEQVRALLPDGYIALIQELAAPFHEAGEKTPMAHWAFTSDGNLTSVYLTVIPNPETDMEAPALIARELLSPQERIDLEV